MYLQEKINFIKEIDTYNARFIVKVLESFENKQNEFEKKKKFTNIIIKNTEIKTNENVIDLDRIWAKPYFYTRMRVRLEELVNQVKNTDIEKIKQNPSKFFKKIIFNNTTKNFEKPKEQIDIVDFIKGLNNEKKYIFIAKKIDEETIFKLEQIQYSMEILKLEDVKERYSIIYDIVCEYLNKDFISNQYCDFKNNKCIAQRKHRFYPINKKNGCCFKQISKCPNLNNGKCEVECMACKLFACNYLGKMGIGYWANEIVLFNVFFNKKQRKHLVFDFYKPKEIVLKKVYEKKSKIT